MAVTARNSKDLTSFKKESATSKHLPYSYHVNDHIISTINGDYLTTFKIRGRTHGTASDAELIRWHTDLNQVLRSVGTEHVKFWTHEHHHAVDGFQQAEFDLYFAKHFDASYRRSFDSKPLMVNDLYLTIVYNPVGDISQKMFAKLERPSSEELADLRDQSIESLEEICSQFAGALKPYGAERLGIYYRDENGDPICNQDITDAAEVAELDALDLELTTGDGDDLLALTSEEEQELESRVPANKQRAYSTVLEWFGFLCNGEWNPVPVTRSRIRQYLMLNRPVSSLWGDVLQLRAVDSVAYTAGIEITDYDEETEPGQLNQLKAANFEYVLTQSFCCMSSQAALGFLSRQERALMETQDAGVSQTKALKTAADGVKSRRFIMGFHHATVHVYGKTAKEAQRNAREARVIFNKCGMTANSVGLASEAAFYARLPANQQYCPRPVPINSWNFLCFSPFHNFMSGKPLNNPWGQAVTVFKSSFDTPVFFNFHVTPESEFSFGKRPAAHTLILGQTGSGKTTLLNSLITQGTKFKPRLFYFDKDRGGMPLITALQGRYKVLREGEPSGFAPAQMQPTNANVGMMKRLCRVMAETIKGGVLEPADVERIGHAVDHVMVSGTIPLEYRSITAIVQHIPHPARTQADQKMSLVDLLRPWCQGHENGWLFDNPRDMLNLSTHDAYGFDLTEFIAQEDQPAPVSRTPLLMYLFFRVRQSIDGSRRTINVFDEFAQYLDDPYMDLEVKRGLKTDRKKDCIYVFATQEPNDALDSRIGKTIMQSCVTKILLENPGADPDDYMKGLKLTHSEYRALLEIPENSRQFLLKQGGQSTIASMLLPDMEREISILSGTPDNADRLEQIVAKVGDDPEVWLPIYWRAVLKEGI